MWLPEAKNEVFKMQIAIQQVPKALAALNSRFRIKREGGMGWGVTIQLVKTSQNRLLIGSE